MRGCLTLLFFFVLVLLVVGYFTGDDDAYDSAPEHSEYEAWMVCQDAVRQRLKAPSTANFGPFDERLVVSRADVPNADPPMPETRYVVRSYVDAENSFGAMIRTDYICTVEYVENEQWRLLALDW